MHDQNTAIATSEKYVIVVNMVETSPITTQWYFLSYEHESGVNDIHLAEVFDTLSTAKQALSIVKPVGDSLHPFIFPISMRAETTYTPNWKLAYKMLKDRGVK